MTSGLHARSKAVDFDFSSQQQRKNKQRLNRRNLSTNLAENFLNRVKLEVNK